VTDDRMAGVAGPLVRCGNVFFRYRNALFPVVLAALFFGFRPEYPRGSEWLDNLTDVVGVLVAVAGQSLRVAVIGYAYIVRGGRNRRVYAEGLVTQGFFAHSRNPLYLGNILVLFGLFIIHDNTWVYAIGVPFFLFAYIAIVATDEAYLRRLFGAGYEAYTSAVPRWIPTFAGLRTSLDGMRFNWQRVILKEYGSTFAWAGGAVVLMIADTIAYFPYSTRVPYINALLVCLVILAIGWGTARYLKKSRRLREVRAA